MTVRPETGPALARVGTVAAASILVALVVMGIKYVAYLRTGSVALYSDALESIVNVVTAVAALIAIRVGARPADREHPYGHHKAEFFSAVLEGVLILVAALMILREAYDALVHPRILTEPVEGMLINGAATALNTLWAALLIGRGRTWKSPALTADGWHLVTDVATSVGVLAGLVLATATGWQILDPLIAAAVALNILWTGYRITTQSMSGLLDEAVPRETELQIRDAIKAHGDGALQVHDIRTRHAGPVTFVEFHLVVPGAMTVQEAHDICDRLEDAIRAAIGGAHVVIHVEPEHKAKSKAAVVF
jgi:cation diffusion facilitator family transporter